MKTKTILSSPLACAATLALAATVAWSCAGKFEYGCPEGSTQTAGGGDVKDACTPNDQLPGGSGGTAGGGGAAGSGAGMAGTGGGTQGGGGAGGAGGQGGGALIEENVFAIAGSHACARTSSEVLCWGNNQTGELGSSVNIGKFAANPTPSPVDSGLLSGARQLAVNYSLSCVLREDGRVVCWGSNRHGELGTTTNNGESTPNPVPVVIDNASLGNVRQLSVGNSHICALRDDGRVLCWGKNRSGQLGNGKNNGTDNANPEPQLVESDAVVGIRQVAAGDDYTCALRDDGRVLCWGSNLYGTLGTSNNSGTGAPNPTPILVDNSTVVGIRQLGVGFGHTCALRDDSRVVCWGFNFFGQLGRAITSNVDPTPALVDGGALENVRQIATDSTHSCALRDDGRVLCWGRNTRGQLGNSTGIGTDAPTPVPALVDGGALTNVRYLSLGGENSCALRDDGHALCWGENRTGQLGNNTNLGTETPNPTPVEVQGLPPLSLPSQL